jgi:acetoin utilization deacetylase AcuC-like enzyme
MRVALVTHPSSLDHRGPPSHPERPDRVEAAIAGVGQSTLITVPFTADPVDRDALLEVHDEAYVDALEQFCARGGGAIDLDTFAGEASWQAALNAAGAGATAVQALQARAADVGFIAMRPPGHHAERSRAMGFCLFNNVAIAASSLARAGNRVAIVDWDVHHGNGTQDLFATDPNVLYVSIHQHPFYPGTGLSTEIGDGAGAGKTINVPMPHGSGGAAYEEAMRRIVLPIVSQFAPDWLLVSAGYDAHASDPLAGIELAHGDYAMMASGLAPLVPPGRTVYFLEGGYDLEAIRSSVAATLDGYAGAVSPPPAPAANWIGRGLDQIVETLAPYWDVG